MARRHVIDFALDLARMPALARTSVQPALPPNIVELMRIAAACPEACEAAMAETGEPVAAVIEAARFYLQQMLFRQDADCYRVLGIEPTTSRATARSHMRWLLKWLHPDRNSNSWDAVYADRVLKAWREVSASQGAAAKRINRSRPTSLIAKKNANSGTIWLPWIAPSVKRRSSAIGNSNAALLIWMIPTSLVIIFLALWLADFVFRP
jgi:hypothetical protein